MTTKAKTTTDVATIKESPSERFTSAVIAEYQSNNSGVSISSFQKRLIQNYFVKIDTVLKDAERKRLAKTEKYRDPVEITWQNVNLNFLATQVVAFSSMELDPTLPNHLHFIPYKNNSSGKYDLTGIIGYNGCEIKAKKFGLDFPDDVIIELVFENDTFNEIKKDINNRVESYEFSVNKPFDRGAPIGGFYYYNYIDTPEKNKLRVFNIEEIEKRKPEYASVEFWGGEKDVWKDGKKDGKETIAGWYKEMLWKTLKRAAFNNIPLDSKKIDDNVLQIISNENQLFLNKDTAAEDVSREVATKANKKALKFDDAEDAEVVAEEVKPEEGKKEEVKTQPGF